MTELTKENTLLVTPSYDKHLEWLKYNIKSYETYCTGYYDHLVLIDENADDCLLTKLFLQNKGYSYEIVDGAQEIMSGHMRQQYMKLTIDEYIPDNIEYVAFMDSDSMFYEKHSPADFIDNESGKLTMLMTPLNYFYEDINNIPDWIQDWKQVTSETIELDLRYEYARRSPLVYPVSVIKELRSVIEKNTKMTLKSYLAERTFFSEYNVLGEYIHKHHKNLYEFVDTTKNKWEALPCLQSCARSNNIDELNDTRKFLNTLINAPIFNELTKHLVGKMYEYNMIERDIPEVNFMDYNEPKLRKLYNDLKIFLAKRL
jgi:hypothetical protein